MKTSKMDEGVRKIKVKFYNKDLANVRLLLFDLMKTSKIDKNGKILLNNIFMILEKLDNDLEKSK